MGTSNLKNNNIFKYYIFQKKFKKYLTGKIFEKERKIIKNGYLIPLDWIKEWKRKINYNIISKNLDSLQIESTKLKENQINEIKNIFQNNINNFDNNMLNNIIINNNFIINERILSEKFLESFVNEKTYKLLKIDRKIGVEEIKYIFKQKMMILFLENYNMIKILFSYDDPMIKKIKLINITFIIDYLDVYYALQKQFRDETSDNILILFHNLNINILIKQLINILSLQLMKRKI